MWETVIGLEIHVQLRTRTKLFCPCRVDPLAPPNTMVCPVCLGLPGALPVPNAHAVLLGVRASRALDAAVASTSRFARKNYFYPDLPKGYQISQFEEPLARGGALRIASPTRGDIGVRFERLHLEEDAGRLVHDRVEGATAVDLNRAGVPLLEIVTAPDLRSPAEARAFLHLLKQVLEYLDVSDCDMEAGQLRVDANLSVRPEGSGTLGVKQELKNLNSFAAVERALQQLAAQQTTLRETGGAIEPSTFSAAADELRVLRRKEAHHDYRYTPDPDLPPLILDAVTIDTAGGDRIELPTARHDRFEGELGLRPADATVLVRRRALADYFEAVVAQGTEPRAAAKWVIGPVLELQTDRDVFAVGADRVADLIRLVARGGVSEQAGKRVLRAMAERPGSAEAVAAAIGVRQVQDASRIEEWVEAALAEHPDAVERYRGGEGKVLGFLIGDVMKRSRGAADPKRVRTAMVAKLGVAQED